MSKKEKDAQAWEWGEYVEKGTIEEQNRIVDEWVARRNKHIGEIIIPRVGEHPASLDNFYGSQTNEWVTTDLIRRYAEAMGDRNPMWRSQDYARKSVWGGMIAQPTILDSIAQPVPGANEPEQWKKFNSWVRWPSEHNYELYRPIRPGDRIHLAQKFLGILEEECSEPAPTRQFADVNRIWFINQREETVGHVTYVRRAWVNRPGGEHGVPRNPYDKDNRIRRRLTDEERDAIYAGYDNEWRRGNEPFYWEDVSVGDEAKPLVVGPISLYDTAATYSALGGHAVGFATQWDRMKLDVTFGYLDDEVNAYKSGGECHFADRKGHAQLYGGGYATAQAQTIYGARCHAICNWMGDNGFVRSFKNYLTTITLLGDVLDTRIKVIKKYTDGDACLVDLDVKTYNQDNILLVDGSATVQLPTRNQYGIHEFRL